jgi:hypothetical protein
MKSLIENKELAMRLGNAAKQTATERFNITRFTAEWKELFERVINRQAVKQKMPESKLPAMKI